MDLEVWWFKFYEMVLHGTSSVVQKSILILNARFSSGKGCSTSSAWTKALQRLKTRQLYSQQILVSEVYTNIRPGLCWQLTPPVSPCAGQSSGHQQKVLDFSMSKFECLQFSWFIWVWTRIPIIALAGQEFVKGVCPICPWQKNFTSGDISYSLG